MWLGSFFWINIKYLYFLVAIKLLKEEGGISLLKWAFDTFSDNFRSHGSPDLLFAEICPWLYMISFPLTLSVLRWGTSRRVGPACIKMRLFVKRSSVFYFPQVSWIILYSAIHFDWPSSFQITTTKSVQYSLTEACDPRGTYYSRTPETLNHFHHPHSHHFIMSLVCGVTFCNLT